MHVVPTSYQVKKAALYPKIVLGRRRERHQQGFVKEALDRLMYSRSIYGFIDAHLINPEILVDVQLGEGDVALDVGAFDGTWAKRVASRSSQATIYSFELSPSIAADLTTSVAEEPQIVVQPYGLGASDEAVRISRSGRGSSVYQHLDKGPTDEGRIRDIADVWSDLALDRVALMKINIEGGEYPLLDRMIETGLLDQVDCFLIQFHEWLRGSHSQRRRIQRELRRSHEVVWDFPFVWERWQRR